MYVNTFFKSNIIKVSNACVTFTVKYTILTYNV